MSKRFLAAMGTALTWLMLLAAGCGGGGGGAGAAASTSAPAADTQATAGGMRALTSVQLSKEMMPGINLGNTLEALPSERSWGAS